MEDDIYIHYDFKCVLKAVKHEQIDEIFVFCNIHSLQLCSIIRGYVMRSVQNVISQGSILVSQRRKFFS